MFFVLALLITFILTFVLSSAMDAWDEFEADYRKIKEVKRKINSNIPENIWHN